MLGAAPRETLLRQRLKVVEPLHFPDANNIFEPEPVGLADLEALRGSALLPPAACRCLELVFVLLYAEVLILEFEHAGYVHVDWGTARRILTEPEKLLSSLHSYDDALLVGAPHFLGYIVQSYLEGEAGLTEERFRCSAPLCVGPLRWSVAVVKRACQKFEAKKLRREIADIVTTEAVHVLPPVAHSLVPAPPSVARPVTLPPVRARPTPARLRAAQCATPPSTTPRLPPCNSANDNTAARADEMGSSGWNSYGAFERLRGSMARASSAKAARPKVRPGRPGC